jgi:hypothetical protein
VELWAKFHEVHLQANTEDDITLKLCENGEYSASSDYKAKIIGAMLSDGLGDMGSSFIMFGLLPKTVFGRSTALLKEDDLIVVFSVSVKGSQNRLHVFFLSSVFHLEALGLHQGLDWSTWARPPTMCNTLYQFLVA